MSSPSSSPSPTPPGQDQRGPTTSSNLYLVTFLATLFLLLFVSCAIVLRSYILRRRYQRRLDEAMAAGMLLAPRTQGSKRKRFGTKPKFYDTWLANGGITWDHIKPLAAQPVFVKRRFKEAPSKRNSVASEISPPLAEGEPITNGISASSPQSTPTTAIQPTALGSRVRNLWSRSRPSPSTHINDPADPDTDGGLTDTEVAPTAASLAVTDKSASKTAGATTGYKVRVEMLQVSVLIAMPSPNRTQRKNAVLDRMGRSNIEDEDEDEDRESELPELVFGISRVNYRQPKAVKSPITPSPPSKPPLQKEPTVSMVPEEES